MEAIIQSFEELAEPLRVALWLRLSKKYSDTSETQD
jgi:hypothetical protein